LANLPEPARRRAAVTILPPGPSRITPEGVRRLNAPRQGRFAGEGERYRTLLEVNNAIISSLSREALFSAIAHAIARVVPFDRTAIFLHDPRCDVLRLFLLESSLPSSYFSIGFEVPASESHVGWVFQNRRPLLRHDLARGRENQAEEQAYADGVRSFAIVPMTVRDRAIGTLAVASTTAGQYDEADVGFLQEVANQVGLAVENMLAYEEIAALKGRLERENAYLKEEIQREHNFVEMVGSSPALLAALAKVDKVAPTDTTVLIYGETGTGKELVARAVHSRSRRKERPLVKVNCSAISAGLVESELFGHVKGAFTGALERRIGRFELADGGTIFLDEIGELPLETQVKLLRVVQEQEFEPVGSSTTKRVDVRVIAATNRQLAQSVAEGRFRADLFYRLNVFPLEAPPLRERLSDVPQLAAFFLTRYARKFGKSVDSISEAAMERLRSYAWPGNVRELQNVIERAVVLATDRVLDIDPELTPTGPAAGAPAITPAAPARDESTEGLAGVLEGVERAHILAALQQSGGVVDGARGAARLLKMHPNTLRSRMEKLGIKR
jgi:formate hydrogenlyase transcriptional activator